jgi:hypothetical protein
MKTIILGLFLFACSLKVSAQNVGNPSFDSVYIGGIDRIHEWITSDAWFPGPDTVTPKTPNSFFPGFGLQHHELLNTAQLKYSGAFHGNFAIILVAVDGMVKTDGSPYTGFVANGNHFYTDNLGYIDYSKGGEPFSYRPTKLRGHYKFQNTSALPTNYGKAIVLLKKYNTLLQKSDTIAYAVATTQLSDTAWTAFELPLTYFDTVVPDSLVLVIEASATGLSGSLCVDSLGFYYSQPSAIGKIYSEETKPFLYDEQNKSIKIFVGTKFKDMLLFNQNGKLLQTHGANSIAIDLSYLPKGIYMLQINFLDNQSRSYKIVR